ncbi:MAG: hypothetical protein Q9227_001968 [Pyrenula ochraceoflavens]
MKVSRSLTSYPYFRIPFAPHQVRPFSSTVGYSYPRKGAEDRNSINTEASEYSKSGSDNGAAHQNEAAFDPTKTDPQEMKEKAGEGNDVNPLEVSPANPEVSQQRGETEGGPEKGTDKDRIIKARRVVF